MMHVSHIEVLFESAHSYLDDNACMLFMILRIEGASTTREVVLYDMEAWQRQPSVWETCTKAGNCSHKFFDPAHSTTEPHSRTTPVKGMSLLVNLRQCSIKFGIAHWMGPRPKITHGVPPAAFTITQSYTLLHIKLCVSLAFGFIFVVHFAYLPICTLYNYLELLDVFILNKKWTLYLVACI